MSRDDWWDALYRDTDHDTTTPRQARDRTRQDTTSRDTTHGPGRVLTLNHRPQGPRPLDELTAERNKPKPQLPPPAAAPRHRDTDQDAETLDPSQSRLARRALRKKTAEHTNPDTEDTAEETGQPQPEATEQDTEAETPRGLGQRINDLLGKAQQGATGTATNIVTNISTPPPEAAAEQERMVRALDQLTEALRPVEPTRTWAPNWFGTVGTVLLFNISAAAAGHYSAAQAGYPDLSPAVIIYDLVAPTAQGQYHWSSPLIFGVAPVLACYLLIDRRARKRKSTLLRWIARIPLATTTAGALAATWHIIVHVTTGAPQ